MEGNTIILIASIIVLGIAYYIDYKLRHNTQTHNSTN